MAIGQWSESELARFISNVVRSQPAGLPRSLRLETLEVTDQLTLHDRVDASPRARSNIQRVTDNTPPKDADLKAGELAIWFDPTNGASKLMVKAKQADGTVKTGSIALA